MFWLILTVCAIVTDAYQEEDYRKRLEALMQLAELCIELLKQNDEHYADVSVYGIFPVHCYFRFLFIWLCFSDARFWVETLGFFSDFTLMLHFYHVVPC